MSKLIIILLCALGVVIVGGILVWQLWPNNNGVACTMEAKLCPDGSSVGRIAPDCEFAECSVANSENGQEDIMEPFPYQQDAKLCDNDLFVMRNDHISDFPECLSSSLPLITNSRYMIDEREIEGYEFGGYDVMVNLETGKDMFESYNFKEIYAYWSPDKKTLAIKSVASPVDGSGIDALYISDYGNPDKLNLVKNIECRMSGESQAMNINFIGNDKLTFFIDYYYQEPKYFGDEDMYSEVAGYIENYEYNIKTKELKELNHYNLID
jgi:hypothetical protein